MANSKSSVVLAALLVAALSVPAHARSSGGGHGAPRVLRWTFALAPKRVRTHRHFSAASGPAFFSARRLCVEALLSHAARSDAADRVHREAAGGNPVFLSRRHGYYPACAVSRRMGASPAAMGVPPPAPETFDGAWSPLAPRD